mmetsp:Transcript_54349/g.156279  ORF Transcript_54349/g.156279 Transcript_54349/m.156279 type:complete len:283 (+) Transcript_54349:113-961(+)
MPRQHVVIDFVINGVPYTGRVVNTAGRVQANGMTHQIEYIHGCTGLEWVHIDEQNLSLSDCFGNFDIPYERSVRFDYTLPEHSSAGVVELGSYQQQQHRGRVGGGTMRRRARSPVPEVVASEPIAAQGSRPTTAVGAAPWCAPTGPPHTRRPFGDSPPAAATFMAPVAGAPCKAASSAAYGAEPGVATSMVPRPMFSEAASQHPVCELKSDAYGNFYFDDQFYPVAPQPQQTPVVYRSDMPMLQPPTLLPEAWRRQAFVTACLARDSCGPMRSSHEQMLAGP